mgnify:FL=1
MSEKNIETYRQKLAQYIKLSSVSAKYQNIPETADFLKQTFEELGGKVQVFTDEKFPLVFADFPVPDEKPGAPTILFYNHYDVQPAEPYDLWHTDPWTLDRKSVV